jgi:hypothetical protein
VKTQPLRTFGIQQKAVVREINSYEYLHEKHRVVQNKLPGVASQTPRKTKSS